MNAKLIATFKFALGDQVTINSSAEEGQIASRCEDLRMTEKRYLVEYVAADGRATDGWFYEDQLALTHAE